MSSICRWPVLVHLVVYWCLAPTKASCWSSSLSRWTSLLGRSGIVLFQLLSRPKLQINFVSFLRPAYLLPVSQWFAPTVDQSWRSVYHMTELQSQSWSQMQRFQNQRQSQKVKMNGWVRSQPAVKIAPSQLSRSLLRGLFRSPTYFRWIRYLYLSHTSGEAMNDPSIYPLRSLWAKVKISPSLMKSRLAAD